MKRLAIVVALVLLPQAARASGYGVFCANGKIEIDGRSPEQMKSQRDACQFARFPFRMDAESFTKKNFGRVGATCSCK